MSHKNLYTKVHGCIIHKNPKGNQPKYKQNGTARLLITKYLHNEILFSHITRIVTWTNPENVNDSERSKSEKPHMLFYLHKKSRRGISTETESKLVKANS